MSVVGDSDKTAIRAFHVNIPKAALADLHRRLAVTRRPEQELEARLNAVPNFITEIDGLDIHSIHVRSKHENALPLIVTHGWPGSVVE